MAYGEKNKVITEETAFWVFPWKKISIWISGLIILIVILIWGIKRYNRRIIRKALEDKRRE
jgi:flagellar biogenesis protein FliO